MLKKCRKKCWHNLGHVVLYTSRRDTATKQKPKSLGTEPWKLNIEPRKKRMCGSSAKAQDQVKLISFNNKSQIGSSKNNLFWRVWSWLRTNAGGMPNTCKSNGEFLTLRIFSVTPSGESEAFTTPFKYDNTYRRETLKGFQCWKLLVANGWVTRRQPAL